jgi:3-deoxy-7-phosphoheptulonate synthase
MTNGFTSMLRPTQSQWTPQSWRAKTARQQPVYADSAALADAVARLSALPPLVTSWEIESLKSLLARAAAGDAFLLQGGDCSERIVDCSTESIVRQLKVLIQMSFVLTYASMKPIVRVGRIAGQYAKPRSEEMETRDGLSLPVYRGDMINRSGFNEADRQADPELLVRGYERAAVTLNFIRALSGGGFADLHHPENWDLEFAKESPQWKRYHQMAESITSSLRFMETILDRSIATSKSVEMFTSHEGLHLTYEEAQTRQVPRREGWYNVSTHFPWIGNRTRQLDDAHVEYFRGIRNPIGVKIDATTTAGELVALVERLNPENELGRLTLIHRFGAERIQAKLPELIEALRAVGSNVLWCCDPMHGNTVATRSGTKTRHFSQIVAELRHAFAIHRASGSRLGGVHLELTGDNVTECIGGTTSISEADLARNYRSPVDPRLNYDQAMEIAFLIADQLRGDA